MGIAVPVIKTEKEQFEMSPLRDDCFNIDLQEEIATSSVSTKGAYTIYATALRAIIL